jgi:hypothetical protein
MTLKTASMGTIPEVLADPRMEYDQDDWVCVPYDDLYDLVHPRSQRCDYRGVEGDRCELTADHPGPHEWPSWTRLPSEPEPAVIPEVTIMRVARWPAKKRWNVKVQSGPISWQQGVTRTYREACNLSREMIWNAKP